MTKFGLGGSKKSNARHQNDSKKLFNHLNTSGNVTNTVLTGKNSGNNLVGNSTDSDDEFAPLTIQNTIEMLEKSKFTTRLLEH